MTDNLPDASTNVMGAQAHNQTFPEGGSKSGMVAHMK